MQLAAACPEAEINWVVFSALGERKAEATASAARFLDGVNNRKIRLEAFRDGFFPQCSADIKEQFESIKRSLSPSTIFTHYRHDLHQDHRVINELTWNTFRNHLILEYEIPKYDGDLGSPGVFVPASSDMLKHKSLILKEEYVSQTSKQWFSESTFMALARLRGIESNAPEGYAEAFYCRKMMMNF